MGRLTGGDPSLLRRINSAVVLHALRGRRADPDGSDTDHGAVPADGRRGRRGAVRGGSRGRGPARRERGAASGAPCPEVPFPGRGGAPARGGDRSAPGVGAHLGARRPDRRGGLPRGVGDPCGADDRLDQVRAVIADVLRRTGVARSSLRAVGVGSPGIVEADGTVRLGTALPDWTGLALGERLRRSFRCPVLVENDANAAAVAEHWKGAATESDDVVFVLAGLSPGAGSLIGGRLHRGSAVPPGRSALCTCWAGT